MRTSFVSIATLAGSATALPLLSALDISQLLSGVGPASADDPRFTTWTAPGEGDVRGPCPGLNTAANHGFINHSGKDLSISGLIQGLAEAMNIGPDFSTAVGAAGLLSSPNLLGGTFMLQDLDQHNFPIEHDASISRSDAYFGDDHSFNQTYYNQYFNVFGRNTTSDIKSIAYAKDARYQDSLKRNPQFTFSVRETVLSFGENALWVQVLGDPYSGVTNLDYARYFFENERFPYELGWRVSQQQISLLTLGTQIVQIYLAGPEPLPEGAEIVADSYKDVFELIVGGSEVLNNLTQGISGILGL